MTDAQQLDELLEGLRGGDRGAFRACHDLMADQLHRFAVGLIGDRLDAEDVTQDVFLRLVRHARGFRGDGQALLAWLYTTTRRRCLDRRRRLGRRREDPVAEPPEEAVHDRNTLPGNARVHEALAQITEQQRAAILLRRVHGFSGDEVGRILGLDREAVYALCARGEKRLRVLLGSATTHTEGGQHG